MELFGAVLLGAVQGLTEFLPVSSSGHLVFLQSVIPGFQQTGVTFDVLLHLATVIAVLIYFRDKLLHLSREYLMLLLIGTIPAAFFGYFFSDFFESLFSNVKLVGAALLVTSLINYLTATKKVSGEKLSSKKALLIGAAQALAIVPGISRSGSTIFSGVLAGIKKEKAAEFSFLLSIPAILGANILQFVKYGISGTADPLIYVAGFLAAFITGYFAIIIVFKSLAEKKYIYFSIYTLLAGIFVLLF